MSIRAKTVAATSAPQGHRLAHVLAVGQQSMLASEAAQRELPTAMYPYDSEGGEEDEDEEGSEEDSDMDVESEEELTPEETLVDDLHEAITDQDVARVRELLAKGAEPNARDRGHGWTAFTWAAASTNSEITSATFEIVKALVEHGASLTTKDENGYTGLMYAIVDAETKALSANRLDPQVDDKIVHYLLHTFPNADTKTRNKRGESAYDMAETPQMKALLKSYDDRTPPWMGTKNNDPRAAQVTFL